MQERRLGHSGLKVSRLALGTMSFGAAVDDLEAEEQVKAFLDAGGTLIDTAPVYGDGQGEATLGRTIATLGARDRVVLASKAGVGFRAGTFIADTSRRTLLDQLDQSLRALETDHLDLWQVHYWDEETPVEETLAALEHAVASGKVRYVGISNFAGWQTSLAHTWLAGRPAAVPLVSTQVEYSLVNRGIEAEVVPAVEHHGMGILAWSPLGRGVLTAKYRGGIPADSRGANPDYEQFMAPYMSRAGVIGAVARAADGLKVSPAQVALAWLRDRPGVASAIVGARTTAQLAENLGSEQVDVPAEILAALDDVSAPHDSATPRQES